MKKITKTKWQLNSTFKRLYITFLIIFLSWNGMAATYTVTNLNDSGPGSLRQAILNANANPGPDIITFSISGTINVVSPTMTLSDASGGTTIDGTTAPGYAGVPLVVLSGPGSGSNIHGIYIESSDNTILALQIVSFTRGIYVTSNLYPNNTIAGNYIGTDGSNAIPNGIGIWINSSNNMIGGTTVTMRNIISGNNGDGIYFHEHASDNIVVGNYIRYRCYRFISLR